MTTFSETTCSWLWYGKTTRSILSMIELWSLFWWWWYKDQYSLNCDRIFFTPVDCVGSLPSSSPWWTWPFWNGASQAKPMFQNRYMYILYAHYGTVVGRVHSLFFFIVSRIVCVPEFDICIHYMATLEHGGQGEGCALAPLEHRARDETRDERFQNWHMCIYGTRDT